LKDCYFSGINYLDLHAEHSLEEKKYCDNLATAGKCWEYMDLEDIMPTFIIPSNLWLLIE
jgi:hypothetical protein